VGGESPAAFTQQRQVAIEVVVVPTRELPRREWRGYCDRISKALAGQPAELDVVSLALGDRVEARWLPLLGIVYDARSDVVEVALEGVGHSISQPREVYAEETPRGLVALEIIAADETHEIVRFREPLALPTPRDDGERRN
jgi:hypothetical protein